MKPIVVAVAITGSVPRKKDNPALPVTPAEQVESTHEAYEPEPPSFIFTSATPTKAHPPTPNCSVRCRRAFENTAPA